MMGSKYISVPSLPGSNLTLDLTKLLCVLIPVHMIDYSDICGVRDQDPDWYILQLQDLSQSAP